MLDKHLVKAIKDYDQGIDDAIAEQKKQKSLPTSLNKDLGRITDYCYNQAIEAAAQHQQQPSPTPQAQAISLQKLGMTLQLAGYILLMLPILACIIAFVWFIWSIS